MVDINAYYQAGSAHSERRMASGPSTQLVGGPVTTPNGTKTDRATASIETAISTKAQILHATSHLRLLLETLSGSNMKSNNNFIGASSRRAIEDIGRTVILSGPVTRQQAAPQILVVRFAQYAQPNTALHLPGDPVKLTVGITELALSLDANKNTLEALVKSLNEISGLKAWLLQTRKGLASLIKSLPGTSSSLQPESIKALWRLIQPAVPSRIQPLVISIDEIPAAELRGASTGSARNPVITAAMDNRIALTAQSHSHLHQKETIASLQKRLAVFIREMNALLTLLTGISKRRPSSPNINLTDRIFAQVLLDRLRKITTRPVYGFASNPIFPADIGLEVGDDGLVALNEACFQSMSEHRQYLLSAMVGPNAYSENMLLFQNVKKADLLKPGEYSLIYDPTLTPAIATLDGLPLRIALDHLGRPILRLTGQDQQIEILLMKDTPIATKIVYRLSLFDQLAGFIELIAPSNLPRLQSGTAHEAHDFALSSAQRDDTIGDKLIVAVLTQAVTQSDLAQVSEGVFIPIQVAEFLFYFLWIGLFMPKTDREKRKKHNLNKQPKANSSWGTIFGDSTSESGHSRFKKPFDE